MAAGCWCQSEIPGETAMKFIWTDINATQTEIGHPQIILDRLGDLNARHAAALASGRDKEAAVLRTYWEEQHLQWRRCCIQFYLDQETRIAALIQQATERHEWWEEWFDLSSMPDAPSQRQLRLLGDVPADIMPKTWHQAASALNYIPAYRPPDQDNALEGIRLNAALIEVAEAISLSALQLKESFQRGSPSPEEISNHHAKVIQLEKAITNVEALL